MDWLKWERILHDYGWRHIESEEAISRLLGLGIAEGEAKVMVDLRERIGEVWR